MSEKIVLIDGHSILNRAFFGLPDLTNAQGVHTNAVYGFLNILFKLLEEEKPQYLAVAFDVHAPTFRHKMYAEYKGTRKPMAEELREQVPLMKKMLHAMGILTIEKEGYEADDILGTVSKQCEEQGLEVSVVSGDRDLLQLATDHVQIRIPKTKRNGTEIENYYAADVKEKYQVTPKEFIDVKALMGDTADNIPGVPSIGEKTATKLIVAYGSIENAHEHLAEVTPKRAQTNLDEHYDLAQLSKTLATIDTDAPIVFSLQDAQLQNVFTEEAYVLCKQLEFKNMLNRFTVETPVNEVEKLFKRTTDLTEAEAVFAKAEAAESVGVFIAAEKDAFLGVAICSGEEDCVFLQAEGFLTEAYLKEHVENLQKNGVRIVTSDLKTMLKTVNLPNREKVYDTNLAEYLLNPLKSEYSYEKTAGEFLGLTIKSRVELLEKLSLNDAMKKKPEEFLQYVCNQAYIPWKVRPILEEKVKKEGMEALYFEIELPLVYVLADMESEGICTKAETLQSYSEELAEKIAEKEQHIYELAGETFNINSPKQLGVILFEKLQLPNAKKTKTGYSTAADVLEKLASDYPIVSEILEYRQLAKLKSTYADGLLTDIAPDGRIHSTFNQTITATGRISSTEPNLQNIPIRMEAGRLIRKAFVPRDGFVFVDADYSQIELRVLAHMSQDENLISAYRLSQDIHRTTASQVFHIPFDEVTPEQRRNAKAVNFGIVYGISSFGLSQDLSISKKEAAAYIDRYFETYPGIKAYLDDLVAQAKKNGFVSTLYGRKRPVPEISSSNFMQRSFGERIAMNSPIQGTAADIIKIAMIRVHDRMQREQMKSKLILQVHDELLIEAAKDELDEVHRILEEEMHHAADLAVELEIDMHDGATWYDVK
ncbi:MAG: DNA polymerase I [Lachnospiraceae bacterium]